MSLYTFLMQDRLVYFFLGCFNLRDVGGGGEMRVWGRVLVLSGMGEEARGGAFRGW